MSYDDSALVQILDQLSNVRANEKSIQLKEMIRSLGLEPSFRLCSLAYDDNSHYSDFVKYTVFSNFSSLLHPQLQPEFLRSIIDTLLPLVHKEQSYVVRLSLCRCIACALYHLITIDNINVIKDLVMSLDQSVYISFLSEFIIVLKKSLDVPMLAQKNFGIVVKSLPEFLPLEIDSFINDPTQMNYDLLNFYLTYLKSPPLEVLFSYCDAQEPFDFVGFEQQIRNVVNTKIVALPDAFIKKRDSNHRSHIINFFVDAVNYGIDPKIFISIFHSFLTAEIDLSIINPMCSMIQSVINFEKGVFDDLLFRYLSAISLELAKFEIFDELNQSLSVLSYGFNILYDSLDSQGSNGCEQFSNLACQILTIILAPKPSNNNVQNDDDLIDDEPDEIESRRDDISQMLSYLAMPSIRTAVQILVQNCTQQTDIDTFDWILKFLNNALQLSIDHESNSEFEVVASSLQQILSSEMILTYAGQSSYVATELCNSFLKLPLNNKGIDVFHFILANYQADDYVMKKGIDLARKYKFSFEEIPKDTPLSPKILSLIAKLSPSPYIINWINELMETKDTNNLQVATSLIIGLQKANVQFDSTNYAQALYLLELYPEALKISQNNPIACMQILESASQHQFEKEVRERIVLNAIRSATKLCFGPLTERVLIFADLHEKDKNMKIFLSVSRLFQSHKESLINGNQDAALTDQSLLILKGFTHLLLNDTMPYHLLFDLINIIAFNFNRIYPILDDEFWLTLISFYMCADASNNEDSYDLLYNFLNVDFERYNMIMTKVLSQVMSNFDVLLMYLHKDIINSSGIGTVEKIKLYSNKLKNVYKTYSYYKQFVA